MHRRVQSGMRENPASDRRHGSHSSRQELNPQDTMIGFGDDLLPVTSGEAQPRTKAQGFATGGEEALLTVREVAAALRVPCSWVYERTRRRGHECLPHIKLGKYLRFRSSDLADFLNRQVAK